MKPAEARALARRASPETKVDPLEGVIDGIEAFAAAQHAGAEIVYPLTDEDWGLRRFFVRDPNGAIINVTEHG